MFRLSVAILALAACASSRAPDLVDVGALAPALIIDMRYATDENFTGARVDGYAANKCLLARPAAEALARAAGDLAADGLRLRIHDCYRPQRAVDNFVRWAAGPDEATKEAYYPNVPKAELFARGYIAERSGHSRGATLDLAIDGLDMGGPYDFFDAISHTDNADISREARDNRRRLVGLMARHGFRNYDKEWWHYTLVGEPYPDSYFDLPVE